MITYLSETRCKCNIKCFNTLYGAKFKLFKACLKYGIASLESEFMVAMFNPFLRYGHTFSVGEIKDQNISFG